MTGEPGDWASGAGEAAQRHLGRVGAAACNAHL